MGDVLDKFVTFRMNEQTLERFQEICKETGYTRSQLIRYLVDTASVRPAIVRTEPVDVAVLAPERLSVR